MALPQLASLGIGLGSGFAFGTGYGAGVRFGYEDVYPYLKANMSAIANMLQIPFASSGFKLASGVTERQGQLQAAEMKTAVPSMGLTTPDYTTPSMGPAGQKESSGDYITRMVSTGYYRTVKFTTPHENVIKVRRSDGHVTLFRRGHELFPDLANYIRNPHLYK